MCQELERLLVDKGIPWDSKKNHSHCMNHVINLAVQQFLKSIKAMKTRADGSLYVEEVLDLKAPLPEGFALALYKIRSITKVRSNVSQI